METISVDELLKHKEMLMKKREEARSSMEQYHGAISFIDHIIESLTAVADSKVVQDS